MATTAFPVRQTEDGTGCTDLTLRRIEDALYQSTGVVEGLGVSGTTGASYDVAKGVAVLSKGEADGKTLAYFEGGSIAVSANAGTDARIDTVWLTSHDATQGDADNLVTLGVTEGTPAAAPKEPSIPSYATKLRSMLLPAGSSSTSGATATGEVEYAIPYGASLGILVDSTDTSNDDVTASYVAASGTFALPTDRIVSFKVTITMSSNDGSWADGDGSVYCRLYVDGEAIDNRELRLRGGAENAVSNYYERVAEVKAGQHSVQLKIDLGESTSAKRFWSKNGWAGQCLQVVDVCPA